MARKSEKGPSKPSRARTWEQRDTFGSIPKGHIDRDNGPQNPDHRVRPGESIRRKRAWNATWMLPRIDILRELLGEPPNSIKELEAALLADFKDEVARGRSLKLKSQQDFLSPDDAERIRNIASIGDAERERCFGDLLVFQNPRRHLQQLFSDYKDLPYNEKVTSDPKNDFNKISAIHVIRRESERPRWAEENRSGVRLPMRFSERLIEEIDSNAKRLGVTRTKWIIDAVSSHLAFSRGKTPPESPEYKSARLVNIRVPESLMVEVSAESERCGLTKTEWVRRIARQRLTEARPYLAPDADR